VRVVSPAVQGSAGSSAASAAPLGLCLALLDSHRCGPAVGSVRAMNGGPGPAGNGSPGSVTDRTRRGTGLEIDPGRESAGIGRGVGRHENALIDGDRRRGSARDRGSGRDHGTARRRGAMSGAVHDHHAGSDRHRGRAHRRGATNDGAHARRADDALHNDADSARRRRSRRGANPRAGPCRQSSRPSRRPPWPTAVRRSTR
jgi:hypothetical protein